MEALVPAFIAALLTQLGDRTPLLTAILADRFQRPLTVALAAGMAHALGNSMAAVAGFWLAPMLTPNAQALLLALALLFGGVGALWKIGTPDPLARWHIGALLTAFFGVFILAFGDRAQFFTFAIATGGMPWFAAAGATFGAFAVAFVAAVLGEAAWRRIPFRWIRIGTGILFLIGGVMIGVGALGLL